MKHNTPTSPYDWDNTRDAALKKIRAAAKDSDNEVLKEIAEEEDPKQIAERQKNCEVVNRIVDRCVSNYRAGEYDFQKTVDMICGALKKVK